ncbi:MAG: hypothetical protein AVDCRST_MAG80-797 [uncultured Rubrobacteraceae bacterium]|uniref:Uncharacterized protein n=1 Tax=uncultured Rubrobacteraceae bacterium TaxID=349277 RepID=A0A6J4QCS5_9ACTN|nr:MAG: hypothetical protein AVDCRST_MAG80-797 [uncultured Rubrobacteraceae bacterium]
MGSASTKPVLKRIEVHVEWLEKELGHTDEDLATRRFARARPSCARTTRY